MVKRISSGIKRLDSMMEGGIPENGLISLSGPPGVGKSILALQFMLEGAEKGEKSIYINLDEPRSNIIKTVESLDLGKDFIPHIGKKIRLLCMDYDDFESNYETVFSKIKKDKKIKRLVIDSFNCFFSYMNIDRHAKTRFEIRKILSDSFSLFRSRNFTSMIILESRSERDKDLNHYVQYMVDGIIDLDYLSMGRIERRIFLPKMRWTKQHDSSLMFEINSDGINILE